MTPRSLFLMKSEKLNEAFRIPRGELEERIGSKLSSNSFDYQEIVPLKCLEFIENMAVLRTDVLDALIRSIPLEDKTNGVVYPYEDADISVFRIEPRGLRVAQTFVLKEKVLSIMEAFQDKILEPFSIKGLSKLPPFAR